MRNIEHHDKCNFIKSFDGCNLSYNLWGDHLAEDKATLRLHSHFRHLLSYIGKQVLMIMGFVCCTRYWDEGSGPLGIQDDSLVDLKPLQICCFDNRGCGNSGRSFGAYTTTNMARDAMVLLNHLGWIRST